MLARLIFSVKLSYISAYCCFWVSETFSHRKTKIGSPGNFAQDQKQFAFLICIHFWNFSRLRADFVKIYAAVQENVWKIQLFPILTSSYLGREWRFWRHVVIIRRDLTICQILFRNSKKRSRKQTIFCSLVAYAG